VELESGPSIIVNAQAPTQQLGLASRQGAHHFVWHDDHWEDTRGHGEFKAVTLSHARALTGLHFT
jgi:frataxin-like iron-binding protein CyaY